jgi:hypothetical protein
VTEDERRRAFARQFIVQARSDWGVYELLTGRPDVATCHRLHFLQMACEKLAKAHRLRDTKSRVEELLSSHAGFAKFVPSFCKLALGEKYRGKDAQLARVIKDSRALAREIEKLAPAIDRRATPENAEYPWERDEEVIAPCEHNFPSLDLLGKAGGRTFLKLIKQGMEAFDI